MAVDSTTFRRVLGHFATGVTVVTTVDEDGRPDGLTVSAFCSVSLEPPLVLVCIGQRAPAHAALQRAKVFAVSLLEESQEHVSRRFAMRGGDKLEGIPTHTGELGVPILEQAMGFLECRVVAAYPGGDHTIFLGEVVAGDAHPSSPLLYFRGGYRRMTSG